MLAKILSFNKVEKSPILVENKVNSFLEGKTFKFACQSESTKSGKFNLTVYYEDKPSNIKARVFRDTSVVNLDKNVNEFLATGIDMKWSTQSSQTSSIYIVIFYDAGKANGTEKTEANQD